MDGNESVRRLDLESFAPVEVARRLNVHRYTVYKLLHSGRLQGFRVSNRWRIPVAELERFMRVGEPANKREG